MKILIMTGPLYPLPGNNANLICKLIPHFLAAGHIVHLFSPAFFENDNNLPRECFGVPVHWVTNNQIGWKKNVVYPVVSKIVDHNGWSDAIATLKMSEALKKVMKFYCPDHIISTMEPFSSALCAVKANCQSKTVYIMDPPESTLEDYALGTQFRRKMLSYILEKADNIVTTPFIKEALMKQGYKMLESKAVCMGFPLIQEHILQPAEDDLPIDSTKINLLFCGWLNLGIRSPEYFLKIVAQMDERFCVWFVGRDCDLINKKFKVKSKAEIRVFPPISYQAAINAMAKADILIGLSNFVPVHMPSKTVEYINTGKPFINYYRREDCPTLFYTRRWPMCLNIHEESTDVAVATEQTIDFCLTHRGQSADTSKLEEIFPDCSTEHIARAILQLISEHEGEGD